MIYRLELALDYLELLRYSLVLMLLMSAEYLWINREHSIVGRFFDRLVVVSRWHEILILRMVSFGILRSNVVFHHDDRVWTRPHWTHRVLFEMIYLRHSYHSKQTNHLFIEIFDSSYSFSYAKCCTSICFTDDWSISFRIFINFTSSIVDFWKKRI